MSEKSLKKEYNYIYSAQKLVSFKRKGVICALFGVFLIISSVSFIFFSQYSIIPKLLKYYNYPHVQLTTNDLDNAFKISFLFTTLFYIMLYSGITLLGISMKHLRTRPKPKSEG